MHDRDALGVERAAPVHVALRHLAGEGVAPPFGPLRGHDVEMREQHDRACRVRCRAARPRRRRARAEPSRAESRSARPRAPTRACGPPATGRAASRCPVGSPCGCGSIRRAGPRRVPPGDVNRAVGPTLAQPAQASTSQTHEERDGDHRVALEDQQHSAGQDAGGGAPKGAVRGKKAPSKEVTLYRANRRAEG